jgi:hypothetical protein
MGDCFIPRFARPTRNYDAEQSNDLHAMCMDEINTFKEYFEVLKSSGAYMLKREVYNTVLGRMAERVARLISDQYDEDITVEKLGVFYREDPIHSGESEATKDHVHP